MPGFMLKSRAVQRLIDNLAGLGIGVNPFELTADVRFHLDLKLPRTVVRDHSSAVGFRGGFFDSLADSLDLRGQFFQLGLVFFRGRFIFNDLENLNDPLRGII